MPLPNLVRRLLWVWAFFGMLFVVAVAVAVLLPAPPREPEGEAGIVLRDPAGTEIALRVDLADDPMEWQVGLMHRPIVERGMLFVFPVDQPQAFWMKNTLVPLDIAYFRSDGTWVSSVRMEPCIAEPCATYPSAAPAKYALELPAGGIGAGIGTGWTLRFGPPVR